MCDKTHTSRMIVINQMDRENANFDKALATITAKYGSHIAPIEVPIMEGGKFTGVVCVLENKAFTGEGKTLQGDRHPRQHGRRRRERRATPSWKPPPARTTS